MKRIWTSAESVKKHLDLSKKLSLATALGVMLQIDVVTNFSYSDIYCDISVTSL